MTAASSSRPPPPRSTERAPRYREEVAAKLQRSLDAGKITPMGEQISHDQRSQVRTAYHVNEGASGYTVAAVDPAWAEAGKVNAGCFKSPEEIADAFNAPAFEIDPTYQSAVREKIARSIREGYLNADLTAADPIQRGR